MVKISIWAIVLTVVSLAQTPQDINLSSITNLKEYAVTLIDSVETNKTDKLVIQNRLKRVDGESFIATFDEATDDSNQTSKDKNATNDDISTYKQLSGLSFANDMNYSKDIIDIKSTLIDLPNRDQMDTNSSKDTNKIINEKLIVIRSHYTLIDHLFNATLKDINSTFSDFKVESSGLKIDGYFNPNETLKNRNHFVIGRMHITPTAPKTIGNYLIIDRLETTSQITSNDKTFGMHYKTKLGLLDTNLSDDTLKIEDLNLDLTIGNIDIKAYNELEEFGENHPNPTDADMDKLQALSINLLTSSNITIDLTDLSIGNIVEKNHLLGSSKVTARISLEGDKDLAQMIALNPMLALSALKVDVKIVLSSEMMQRVVKHKKAGLLMLLPPKKEANNFIYEINYVKGKLTINGQKM